MTNCLSGIYYLASSSKKAQNLAQKLEKGFGIRKFNGDTKGVRCILALGGDGFLIQTCRILLDTNLAIYGINCGNFGFLMNEFCSELLLKNIINAVPYSLALLKVDIFFTGGTKKQCMALNDLHITRCSAKVINLEVSVNNKIMLQNLSGDGVVVATPAGSSAYNFSAGGPVLPIHSQLIALTPISPFSLRQFRGAILKSDSKICINIQDTKKRPAVVTADLQNFYNAERVEVSYQTKKSVTLLFNSNNTLEDKVLKYQFCQ